MAECGAVPESPGSRRTFFQDGRRNVAKDASGICRMPPTIGDTVTAL
jgi:hypothetical protein